MKDSDVLNQPPPAPPAFQQIWTAIVDVGDRSSLGAGPNGERFIIPILGGCFYAAPGFDGLSGKVLGGGADRQLIRADGVKELDALYEMQTESGDTLTIRNRVIADETRKPVRYAMSTISVTAPEGDFAWLNRRLIIGTLNTLRPNRDAVVVRAWLTDTKSEA